jgi:hypothetical protein
VEFKRLGRLVDRLQADCGDGVRECGSALYAKSRNTPMHLVGRKRLKGGFSVRVMYRDNIGVDEAESESLRVDFAVPPGGASLAR